VAWPGGERVVGVIDLRLLTAPQPAVTVRSLRKLRRFSVCGARRSVLTDERLLRAHDAELVYLKIGQDGTGFSAGLPDVGPARPEGKKAVDLLLAVGGAAGQVELHAVLDHLAIGDWQEAPVGRRVSWAR
jgi:hypothetical protein